MGFFVWKKPKELPSSSPSTPTTPTLHFQPQDFLTHIQNQYSKFKQPKEISSSSSLTQPQTKLILPFQPHNFLVHIQTQFSTFFQHLSSHPPQWPNKLNLDPAFFHISLNNLMNQSFHTVQTTISSFTSSFPQKNQHPRFACLSPQIRPPHHCFDLAMATEDIEERLAGVPVYALSNSNEEFVLISGVSSGKSLGLFCFNKDDANTLLEQMKSMDPGMRRSSKVVAVALNKVFQLKLDGVSFRFIPDSAQIKNAIKVKQGAGISVSDFSGVPVFQSRSLVLKNESKKYRPMFFRKEDLEDSLRRASHQQNQLNPALRHGDIQVSVLEEIIKAMKESSTSKWDDVVFIPPGFDVSTDLSQQEKLSANA